MKNNKVDPRVLLSLLWTVVLLSMLIRDLHEFLREGYIIQLQSLYMAQETVLLFGILAQIPIFMVLLSRVLPNKTNKWANTFSGILTALGLLSTLPTADMDDLWFASTGFILVIIIIRVAWKSLPPTNVVHKKGNAASET